MNKQSVANLVRPRGSRDDSGELGELLHALADAIEENQMSQIITATEATMPEVLFVWICSLSDSERFKLEHQKALSLIFTQKG